MSADTSTRAVDRLAARMKDAAAWYKRTSACCSERDECGTCAAPACSFGEVMTVLDPTTLRALAAERDALREALEIIAGKRQCIDNLMSNVDVARAALKGGAA